MTSSQLTFLYAFANNRKILFGTPSIDQESSWEDVLLDMILNLEDRQMRKELVSSSWKEAARDFASISKQFRTIVHDYKVHIVYQASNDSEVATNKVVSRIVSRRLF